MSARFDVDPQVVADEGQRVFGGYLEPDEAGYDALLGAREVMVERLLRARSQRDRAALAVEAVACGLVVEAAGLVEGVGEPR